MSSSALTPAYVSGFATNVLRASPQNGIDSHVSANDGPFVPILVGEVAHKLLPLSGALEPGETGPTREAREGCEKALWSLAASGAHVPVPIVSIDGDGGIRLEWRRGSRSAFVTVGGDGTWRLHSFDLADGYEGRGRSAPYPPADQLRAAVEWVTRR